MKLKLTSLFLFLFFIANAQYKITGKVIDSETKKPLEGVSLFLSHTTLGTNTNLKGEFQLDHLKPGKYDLVITSLSYEDNIITVQVGQSNEAFIFQLKPTATQLKEVIVETYDENGWEKWGDNFKSFFIGSPELAKNCVFKNPEVLKFKFGTNSNKLRAFTNEKLIFENSQLGYKIIYLLSKFEIDFNSNTFSFKGYPLFEEMKTNKIKQIAEWNKARNEIYKGSLRHFTRSLFNNEIEKEGFEIRRVLSVSEEESARVKEVFKKINRIENKDSLDYYTKVKDLSFGDDRVILNALLSRDSLVFNDKDSNVKKFYFPDHLQVINKYKKIQNEFAKTLPVYRANEYIRTDISLRTNTPVYIYPNGDYFNGLELLTDGYWAWSEKVSTMLPSDFSLIK